jgi:hypothetical protein
VTNRPLASGSLGKHSLSLSYFAHDIYARSATLVYWLYLRIPEVMALAGTYSLLAGAAAIAFFLLYAYRSSHPAISQVAPSKQPRGVRLHQVNPLGHSADKDDSGVDIVAIHGLDTTSPNTWTFKEEGKAQGGHQPT